MNNQKTEKQTDSASRGYDVWLCDLTYTQQTIASETMPYAVGLLATYAKSKLGDQVKFRLFKFPEKLIDSLSVSQPKVIGFSNYLWNLNLNYAIAEKIKEISPETVIVFGGPNYPLEAAEQEEFLRARPAIDFYIYGEGEAAFTDLLSALIKNDFKIEPVKEMSFGNCHSIGRTGFIRGEIRPRIDIKDTPSPYLAGWFDEFFADNLMPVTQTCRGCPYSCAYCVEGSPYYSRISFREPAEMRRELEYIAQRSVKNSKLNLADSNFGEYEQDLNTAKVIAEIQALTGYPEYIHVATGKNNKDRVVNIAEILKGSLRVSGSVQSTDSVVLENVNRKNVSLESLMQMAKGANRTGSNTYSEIILALPGDSKEKHFKSILTLIDNDFNFLRCYTLMILRGSALYGKAMRRKFGLITKFRVLPRCYGIYQFGQDKIFPLEIEEVCAGDDTLSLKDYIECRCFDLTVEIFYNDGILLELINFLKHLGISASVLIAKIHETRSRFPEGLIKLYDDFARETKNELWDSPDEIERFVSEDKEGVLRKYINGEYGSNLIFKYKAHGYLKCIEEIHMVAFELAKELISSEKYDNSEDIFIFLRELKKYSLYKKINLLETSRTYRHDFAFDLEKMNENNFEADFRNFKLQAPLRIEFKHESAQANFVDMHLEQFGSTIIGISRILSRIPVKKMYRKVYIVNKKSSDLKLL